MWLNGVLSFLRRSTWGRVCLAVSERSNHCVEHSICFEGFADSSHFAVYRLNTYPLIHLGFIHMLLNTIALTPLLERFEGDHGTLLTLAMFLGRTRYSICRGWWIS